MEVGLSALSRGAEWEKNKFWLDTTHFGWATLIVAVSWEKNVIIFTGMRGESNLVMQFQSNVLVFYH